MLLRLTLLRLDLAALLAFWAARTASPCLLIICACAVLGCRALAVAVIALAFWGLALLLLLGACSLVLGPRRQHLLLLL